MEHGHLEGLEERVVFLKESQFWPKAKLEEYQFNELRNLLSHAYENAPFYKGMLDNAGIKISSITSIDDLKKIPTIDKEVIKKNYEGFIAENYKKEDLSYMTTGGSTGNPLKIFADKKFKAYNHANTYFYLKILFGEDFSPSDHKSVRLHGDILPAEKIEKNIFWEERDTKLVMSSYNISKKAVELYVDRINLFRPKYIHAYPSAVTLLAKCMLDQGLKLNIKPDCVLCDSEALHTHQKDCIQKAFSCPVYQVYGHTEGAAIGIQCVQSEFFHFVPQVGILELLGPDGSKIEKEGEKGEIVVTGFNNRVMPFIRYRTGDIGVWTKRICGCGREWPMLSRIEGRLQDYAVDKNGDLVAVGAMLFDYNIDWSGIDKFQIYQDTKGKILFKIKILDGSFYKKNEIRTSFEKMLNNTFDDVFDAEVELTDDIQFTQIGKFRYLDQKLAIKNFI